MNVIPRALGCSVARALLRPEGIINHVDHEGV